MNKNIIENHLKQINLLNTLDINNIYILANIILNCKGNIFLTGVGKNTSIAKYMSDIMKSIGLPSFYFCTLNCTHGDMGVIKNDDILIYLSKSGNTEELVNVAKVLYEKNIVSILISSSIISELNKFTTHQLIIPIDNELTFMIPSTSTISYIFIFNILINVLVYKKELTLKLYGENHPGGSIGYLLNTKVKDIMIKDNLPIIKNNITLKQSIIKMTEFKQSFILYVENELLLGIFTDGDLRRILNNNYNLEEKIKNLINKNVLYFNEDELINNIIENYKNSSFLDSGIPILDSNKKIKGILNKSVLFK